MECFQMKHVRLHQIVTVNALECMSDISAGRNESEIHLDPCLDQIFCPVPRRTAPAFFGLGCCERPYHKRQRNDREQRKDTTFELLDIILTKTDPLDDEERSSTRYFCGSPPARTNNPVVHDIQFLNQTSECHPLCGKSRGGRPSTRLQNHSASCDSSFEGEPMVRIEGFASGNSECHCIVSSFA